MGEIIPRPEPAEALAFDGERFTTSFGGQTAIEHWHRYLLARELARDRDVLDVACGEGFGSALLAQTARSVVGVDFSATAVAHARASYPHPSLRYFEGNALSIPLDAAAVDVVVSFETLEHFRDHDRFLQEVKRVLRPGGLLLISTPDRDTYSPSSSSANPFHQLELTASEFLSLLRRHFAAVDMQGQRVLLGSAMFGSSGNGATPLCFERRGTGHFEMSVGMARPNYLLALATDGALPLLPQSIYVDADRLLHIDGPMLQRILAGEPPPQAAARIGELEASVVELKALSSQQEETLAQANGEHELARRDVPRLAASVAELKALSRQQEESLARANGESELARRDVQRLAAEIGLAEQERKKLAAEFQASRTNLDVTRAEVLAMQAEREHLAREVRLLRDALTEVHTSTSWKVSMPVRAIGRWIRGG